MKNKIKDLLFDSQKGKIKLNDKASIFFFCLLLSTFFWFLSSLSKNYTTTLQIPLSYTEYNKNFILTEKPAENITIRVSGSGFELLGEQMSLNRNSIEISLENARKVGKNRSGYAASVFKNDILKFLDKDLNFIEIQTDSIVFMTQPRVSKKLKLIADLDLEFESSFNLMGDVIIEPKEIMVFGPQEMVDTLDVLKTDLLSVSGISDSTVKSINLSDIERYKGLQFEPSEVKLTIPVEKFTEKPFNLPISITGDVDAAKVKTFPNEVKAIFIVPLSNYEELVAEELNAEVVIKQEDLSKSKLSVKITGVPGYAKLLRIEPEKVEFIIRK